MRARGLKQSGRGYHLCNFAVAPHAGAWIETEQYDIIACPFMSRPMRARGLKPPFTSVSSSVILGRAPCGRVD
mgnify:FL=1